MDTTREALDKICELANAAADITWPASLKQEPPLIAVSKEVTLQDIEAYLPARRSFRGAFSTSSMAAFRDYIAPFATEQPCFIEGDLLRAVTYLDIGELSTPGHCKHHAALQLKKTAPYAALLEANEKPKSQRELAEWLEDWVLHVTALDDAGLATDLARAVRAVRNINIKATAESSSSVQNMGETRGTLAKIEATSEFVLPAGFVFTCRPAEELSEREFRLDLGVITGDKPVLKLRIRALTALTEEIATEFAQTLKGILPVGIRPMVGAFKP